MNFSYVPVLKNRQAEKEALLNQSFSDKIVPLVEFVIEKPNVRSKGNLVESHASFFNGLKYRTILVDIPMYLTLSKKTKKAVFNFLNPIYQNQLMRVNYLSSLSMIKNISIIPVVSYNPNVPYVKNLITNQVNLLKDKFETLAFRLYTIHADKALDEVKKNIKKNDILIFDIAEKHYTSRLLVDNYEKLNDIKNNVQIKTVIVRSSIPNSLKNTELVDGEFIDTIDNSLIDNYRKYGFDAFGDCAGTRRSEIEDIPASSPAYLYYSKKHNEFVGFKGKYNELKTFTSMVLPNYTNSEYWTKLNSKHKIACYGCTMISNMSKGNQSPNSAPKWKAITISHYISSILEIL